MPWSKYFERLVGLICGIVRMISVLVSVTYNLNPFAQYGFNSIERTLDNVSFLTIFK